MFVELDRNDIIALMTSTTPNYVTSKEIPNDLGAYTCGIVDIWKWKDNIPDKYTDEELYQIYLICKHATI